MGINLCHLWQGSEVHCEFLIKEFSGFIPSTLFWKPVRNTGLYIHFSF
jgi:hypothetical protein